MRELLLQRNQAHRQGSENLAGAVMQLAGKPAPLVILSPQKPAVQRSQPLLGIFEFKSSLLHSRFELISRNHLLGNFHAMHKNSFYLASDIAHGMVAEIHIGGLFFATTLKGDLTLPC